MFLTDKDLDQYVVENYPEITNHRMDDDHWDLECTYCKITRGFQVIARYVNGKLTQYTSGTPHFSEDFHAPVTYLFRCPKCKAFKLWSVFRVERKESDGKFHMHYYRLTSLPSEGLEDIEELPEDPPALRVAYRQAIRAMEANAHLAAAAMFRRALQVITRQMLGATPGNLANELREVAGKDYRGVKLTSQFVQNAYIVKEAGNQGAHPDSDPDLLDFTPRDAEDLQDIFMEIVSELFIVPAAMQKAKADFLGRKKIVLR
jgi:hypothetical protein